MDVLLLNAFERLIWLINMLIVVRVLISWVPPMYNSRVGRWIVALTEPVLAPVRNLLSYIPFTRQLPVDFSPIGAWIILYILSSLIQYFFYLFH